jgi:hypothetical protein
MIHASLQNQTFIQQLHILNIVYKHYTFHTYILNISQISLRPKKNNVLRLKIYPKKNDVLLNLACVHVHVGMQQSIST